MIGTNNTKCNLHNILKVRWAPGHYVCPKCRDEQTQSSEKTNRS